MARINGIMKFFTS